MALYNWRKNPSADTTVIGVRASVQSYLPNRFGLYHMTGNVVEWTQSVFKPFSKAKPYDEYERNRPELDGLRVARSGSWYSASVALLYIPTAMLSNLSAARTIWDSEWWLCSCREVRLEKEVLH